MASPSPSRLECPVCNEDFVDPKILPCTHVVCRACLLNWLGKNGKKSGCPFCREPILPDLPASAVKDQTLDDLSEEVDALLTDFATVAIANGDKILSGSHVCICDPHSKATLLCLQCSIKLCKSCAKIHARIPSTTSHVTKKLSSLTAGFLASNHRSSCANHGDNTTELYCMDHKELICLLCASSTHRRCSDVLAITDVAKKEREELDTVLQRLKIKEDSVISQIDCIHGDLEWSNFEFRFQQEKVQKTFDDLKKMLDEQLENIRCNIQKRQTAFANGRQSVEAALKKHRAALSAYESKAEYLIKYSSDDDLLKMSAKLKSCLKDLESVQVTDDPAAARNKYERMTINVDVVKHVEEISSKICEFACPDTALEGPEYAAVIKVGDRVQHGKDWKEYFANAEGVIDHRGTVIKVPMDLKRNPVKKKKKKSSMGLLIMR